MVRTTPNVKNVDPLVLFYSMYADDYVLANSREIFPDQKTVVKLGGLVLWAARKKIKNLQNQLNLLNSLIIAS